MRAFFSAGEASGDRYAAALVGEMRALGSSPTVEGVGGPLFAAVADRLVCDSTSWGAVSISQAAKVFARGFVGGARAKRAVRQGEPGLLIPIDFGFFNIRLARVAKARGWKVLYFIPPGSWRKDRQGRDIPGVSDKVVTPFSWSAEILRSMGAEAHWFGHPLKQLVAQSRSEAGQPRQGIAVLAGSRTHEVELHLPLVAEALRDRPEEIEFGLAPCFSPEWFSSVWSRCDGGRHPAKYRVGDTYRVLGRARAAIVCSGTATLEAALCRCPSVVIYKLSGLMAFEAAIVRPKFEHVALPNILLGRRAVPELVAGLATADRLRDTLGEVLQDGSARQSQLAAFAELDDLLGPSDAITRTAELACGMLGS